MSMPDKDGEGVRTFSLKIRCDACGLEGSLDSGEWPVRVTGAVEAVCPGCGKKTVYVGRFGHGVEAERLRSDLERHGPKAHDDGGTRDARGKRGEARP